MSGKKREENYPRDWSKEGLKQVVDVLKKAKENKQTSQLKKYKPPQIKSQNLK